MDLYNSAAYTAKQATCKLRAIKRAPPPRAIKKHPFYFGSTHSTDSKIMLVTNLEFETFTQNTAQKI